MSWHRADRPGVPGMEGQVNKRERFNRDIERFEVARLCALFPEIGPDDIREIFNMGFNFGFCEGLGAAKRSIQKAIDEEMA